MAHAEVEGQILTVPLLDTCLPLKESQHLGR